MRWLLVQDLRIRQRSRCWSGLLVYPVVIVVLIGFALSRGTDKPEVAFYNGLSEGAVVELGGEEIDLTERAAGCSTRSTPCQWTAERRRSRRCATGTSWAR